MSKSECGTPAPLPAPVSLTLEEAMQVTGGSGIGPLAASHLVPSVIVNGVPVEYWIVSKATPVALPAAVAKTAVP